MMIYMMAIDTPEERSKFEKIYLSYRGLMYHIAYKILNNQADAEDAVHNAFVKIAEHISKIGDPVCSKTKVFVATIVENKAIDIYRFNKRKQGIEYLDDISGISIEENAVHGLAECMAKLSPRYRQVILLKYYQGFSNKEIANLLNITEANAIKIDQRAKKRLRQMYEEEKL